MNRRFEVETADLAISLAVIVHVSLGQKNRLCCEPKISDFTDDSSSYFAPTTTVDASKLKASRGSSSTLDNQ